MIVEAENLAKRFVRHEAVRGVNLKVPEGAAVALIGPNGAGKTTTLRLLMNILRPDAGQARVLGIDSRRLGVSELARIGYVSENQKLPAGLTVGQFFDYLRPLYPNWDRALEAELRRQLDLPADRKLGRLSHGMRVKAALAAALPFRPDLLVLDEPLSGLDPLVRDEVMEGVLAQAGETTVLISSHELAEIEGFATHVAFMQHGRVLFQESMEALTARFRQVNVVFAEGTIIPDRLPDDWLSPKTLGQGLSFTTATYRDDADLARALAISVGEVRHLDVQALSLRDISKALIRASRKETRQ